MAKKKTTKKKTKKKKATKKVSRRRAKNSADSADSKNGLTRRQRDFLAAVKATFSGPGKVRNIREACRIARVDSATHYVSWMSQPAYAEEWERLDDEYQATIAHDIRAETERRAMEGWDEEVIEEEREAIVRADGSVEMVPKKVKRKKTRRYSDMLLALRNNQIFGDARRVELTGKDGGPLQSETTLRFGAVLEAVKKAKSSGD